MIWEEYTRDPRVYSLVNGTTMQARFLLLYKTFRTPLSHYKPCLTDSLRFQIKFPIFLTRLDYVRII